jgi:hypothetical protein
MIMNHKNSTRKPWFLHPHPVLVPWCDLNRGAQQTVALSQPDSEYAAALLPHLVSLGGRIPGSGELTFLVLCLSPGAAQLRVSTCQNHVCLVAVGLQPGNEAAADWSSVRALGEKLQRPQPLPPQRRPAEVWVAVYETPADDRIASRDRPALEKFLRSLPWLLPVAAAELESQPTAVRNPTV